MKTTYADFNRILGRSKEYAFENHYTLVIRSYHTGEEVRLDFSKLTEEMFNEIQEETPKRGIWLACRENIESWEERTGAALEKINHPRCNLEQADHWLYYDIEQQIEDYCWDHDIEQDDLDFGPDEILFYVDD